MSNFTPCTGQHEWVAVSSCIIREYIQRCMISKKRTLSAIKSTHKVQCSNPRGPRFRWLQYGGGGSSWVLNSCWLAFGFFQKIDEHNIQKSYPPPKLTAKAPGYRRSGPKRKGTHLPTIEKIRGDLIVSGGVTCLIQSPIDFTKFHLPRETNLSSHTPFGIWSLTMARRSMFSAP